ncbi:MAG: hypothetical protein IPF66_13480 [Holophagales bacterium]|nr:hypothetical protein [Holophagales bacterium]
MAGEDKPSPRRVHDAAGVKLDPPVAREKLQEEKLVERELEGIDRRARREETRIQ